jgi:Ca2+-binding RTX toxin-like protein
VTTGRRALGPLLLAAALCWPAGAEPASAATASVLTGSGMVARGQPSTWAKAVVAAGAGESNDLTLSRASDETLRLHDAGAVLTPGAGCTSVDAHSVTCSFSRADQRAIEVRLGDLDDRLRIGGALITWSLVVYGGDGDDTLDAAGGSFEPATGAGLSGDAGDDRIVGSAHSDGLSGGDGDDSLSGGDGSDRLRGGFGTDSMDGGSGTDRVDYGDRSRSVTVDLSRPGPQGEAGEADTIENVEEAQGGDGPDILLGSDGPDFLVASSDHDRRERGDIVDGRGGADAISGSAGPDELRGGPGDDRLAADDGADRIDGGPGDDHLSGSSGDDRIDAGAGDDRLDGGSGADRLLAGPGRDRVDAGPPASTRDDVRCGRGRDLLVLFPDTPEAVVNPGCDAIDFSELHIRAWSLRGSALGLRVLPAYKHGRCLVAIRTSADVRRMRLRGRSRRTVRLATASATAKVRVATDLRCNFFNAPDYEMSIRLTFRRHRR